MGTDVHDVVASKSRSGARRFKCVVHIRAVTVARAASLEVAGWTLSHSLGIAEAAHLACNDPGDPDCWAYGEVWSSAEDVESTARSRVDDLVMNVLRLFLDPLTASPRRLTTSHEVLFTSTDKQAWKCASTLSAESQCLELTEDVIARLQSSKAFRRANLVTTSPKPTSLQRTIVLALMQWGAGTQVGPAEVQLRSFLSVLEGIFNLESHEDGLDLAARLVCQTDGKPPEPASVKELLDRLYVVRDGLLHQGYSPASDASPVRPEDVYLARQLSRQAIIHALLHHYSTSNKRELVRELKG